jgi:uncharacterized protein YjiS (DUF1127 family)
MATNEFTHAEGATVGERISHAIEVSAARIAAVWQAAMNRRSVGRLLEWDERMLSDIGLTQGDVRSALAARFADDPSRHLGFLSSERRSAIRAAAREDAARQRFGGNDIR